MNRPNQAMQLTASKPDDLGLECLPSGAYPTWDAQRLAAADLVTR